MSAYRTTPSDLVRKCRLNIDVDWEGRPFKSDAIIVHARGTIHENRWKRDRRLGDGAYGEVYLQRCIKGDEWPNKRAVKRIFKKEFSELEAIVTIFSNEVSRSCLTLSFLVAET